MSLAIGSLFAGIGGLELGLERAGLGRVVFQVEKDPYCRAVLAKHWPDAERFEDVRDFHPAGPVDVLCGGFPCQPWSVAGKQLGAADERHLWPEFARVIDEATPAVVVGENVPGLRARGLRVVLADLAARGFDVEWTDIRAADVGAPHRRERVFIVAAHPERIGVRLEPGWLSRACGEDPALVADHGDKERLADADCATRGRQGDAVEGVGSEEVRGGATQSGRRGSAVANADGEGEPQQEGTLAVVGGRSFDGGRPRRRGWPAEPDVGRVAHGVRTRVDRLRALGNAVVPQVAEVIGRAIVAAMEADEAYQRWEAGR